MNKIKLERIVNIYFYFCILFSIYTITKIYFYKRNIEEGVCVINANNNLITIGIYFLIGYIVLSLIADYCNKKLNKV